MSATNFYGQMRSKLISIVNWFDSDYRAVELTTAPDKSDKVDWVRCIPFAVLHLGCLGVIWTGWSLTAVGIAICLYFLRMFAITGFYHRYFSHRTFSTS